MKAPQVHLHWKTVLGEIFPARQARELFPNSRLRLLARVDRHNPHNPSVNHDHDYFELVLVRSGRARHHSVHGSKVIKRGDVLILPPQIWHRYVATGDLDIYNCCVGHEIFHQHLSFLKQDPFWSGFLSSVSVARQSQWLGGFRVDHARYDEVEASMQRLVALTVQPFGFQTNYQLLGSFLVLLGQLADGLRGQAQLAALPPVIHPLIQRALALIEQDSSRDWRVPELCAQLNGINRAYFIRLFKRNVGLTPKAYITRRRVEKAATRLLATDDPVTEIAIDLGWNDPNLFSRTFRQFFNASPSEYRVARQ